MVIDILHSLESSIKNKEEKTYFLIHEARYKRILQEVSRIMYQVSGENKIMIHDTQTHDTHFRVLDVGCFPYHMGAALELMGFDVWGISSHHEPIKNKNVAILNIETDPFPYKDNFFDLVLCSEVLEHLPHSPVPAIREMYRVTRPGGHILVTTPNIVRSINRGKVLVGKSPVPPIDPDTSIYHRHNHEYTLSELDHVVAKSGWKVTKKTHFVSYTPFRRRNKTDHPLLRAGKVVNYIAMQAIPHLADTLLVIGEK